MFAKNSAECESNWKWRERKKKFYYSSEVLWSLLCIGISLVLSFGGSGCVCVKCVVEDHTVNGSANEWNSCHKYGSGSYQIKNQIGFHGNIHVTDTHCVFFNVLIFISCSPFTNHSAWNATTTTATTIATQHQKLPSTERVFYRSLSSEYFLVTFDSLLCAVTKNMTLN